MRKKLITVAAMLLMLTSCSSTTNFAVQSVDAKTFLSKIADDSVMVIDVRTVSEFNSGHLAGAINFDVESGAFDSAIAGLDKSKTYALYCRSGRRSTLAAEKMANAGFVSIINFNKGGFSELANSGAATE